MNIETEETFENLMLLGNSALAEKRFNEAIKYYESALKGKDAPTAKTQKDNIFLLETIGYLSSKVGQLKKAENYYQDCWLGMLSSHTPIDVFRKIKLLYHTAKVKFKLGSFHQAYTCLINCFNKEIINFSLTVDNAKEIIKLHRLLGAIHREQAKYKEAFEATNTALDLLQSYDNDGNLGIEKVKVLLVQGQIYLKLIKLDKAKDVLSECFHILNKHPNNKILLAAALNLSAIIDMLKGNYPDATTNIQKSIELVRESSTEKHVEVAKSYRSLGIICLDELDLNKASLLMETSYQLFAELLGQKHPHTLSVKNNLGMIYFEQAEYNKTEDLYKEILNERLKILRKSHPDIAESYHRLGELCQEQGKFSESLEYFNKALSIYLIAYNENHLDIASIYNDIGIVYSRLSQGKESLNFLKKALDMKRNLFGENHPSVAVSYSNIGLVNGDAGCIKVKLKYQRKALKIQKAFFGKNGNELMTTYYNLGVTYHELKKLDKALKKHEKALEIKSRVYGDNHPSIADSYFCIGSIYDEQLKKFEAMKYFMKDLRIRLRFYGKEQIQTAQSYYAIGCIYTKLLDNLTAKKYLVRDYLLQKINFKQDNQFLLRRIELNFLDQEIALAEDIQ